MAKEIETEGFVLWAPGDPSVGIGSQYAELKFEGGMLFGEREELDEFKRGLAEYISGFFAEGWRVLTTEEYKARYDESFNSSSR